MELNWFNKTVDDTVTKLKTDLEKGLSQEDLALDSGVNKNYLSDLERGERNPTIVVLEKIATSLGVTLSTLFKGIQSFED